MAGPVGQALVGGTSPVEVLVLARSGHATEPVQRALAHAGIPHRVLGSLGLLRLSPAGVGGGEEILDQPES